MLYSSFFRGLEIARFVAIQTGRVFVGSLLCQAPSEGRPQSVARGPTKRNRAAEGDAGDRTYE